ncbi:hypothetical protein HYW46_01645 [Candidatus Daviesbacteria bacterium]|nr:hypothetical protein [Candidatus Daviesbacteria bacterium]
MNEEDLGAPENKVNHEQITKIAEAMQVYNLTGNFYSFDKKKFIGQILSNIGGLKQGLKDEGYFTTSIHYLCELAKIKEKGISEQTFAIIASNLGIIDNRINQDKPGTLDALIAIKYLANLGNPNQQGEAVKMLKKYREKIFEGFASSGGTYGFYKYLELVSFLCLFGPRERNLVADSVFDFFQSNTQNTGSRELAQKLANMTISENPQDSYAGQLMTKIILERYGLNAKAVIASWKARNGQNNLDKYVEPNLLAILNLNAQIPGIVKFANRQLGVSFFDEHTDKFSVADLTSRYDEYLNCINSGEAYDPWKKDKEALKKFGLDPAMLIPAWYDSYPEILIAIRTNIKIITDLESYKPGLAQFLNYEFGISNFSRYPVELLKRMFEEYENTELPYGIALYPKTDHNGAFYQNWEILNHLNKDIKGNFAFRIFEVGSEYKILKALKKLNFLYGKRHKISFAIVAGHGLKGSIQFGKNPKHGFITIEDLLQRKRRFLMAKTMFENDAPVVFISCNTGLEEGLAENTTTLMLLDTHAPEETTNIKLLQTLIFEERGNRKKHIRLSPLFQKGATISYSAKNIGNEKII